MTTTCCYECAGYGGKLISHELEDRTDFLRVADWSWEQCEECKGRGVIEVECEACGGAGVHHNKA